MSDPLISVIIPTYNYARYLPQALDSVLAQSLLPQTEIILADDASTDQSDAICREYAAAHPCIRYHRHTTNIGMVPNWNWCLQQARGTFIKPLMADDLLLTPLALAQMAQTLQNHPSVALVTSARRIIDADAQERSCWAPLGTQSRILTARAWKQMHLERQIPTILNSIGEPSAVLFRRQQAYRGFDPSLRQLVDLEMWLHLLTQGDLYVFGQPLCAFRQHPRQQTEHNRQLQLHRLEEIEICRRYSPPPFRDRHRFRIIHHMQKAHEPHADISRQALRDAVGAWRWLALRTHYRYTRLSQNLHHARHKRSPRTGVSA